MACDLKAIHEAIETQLKATTIDTKLDVFAFPQFKQGPRIEVVPGGQAEWINYWSTFGPNGKADMMVTIRATLEGLTDEDVALVAWRLAGVGTDNASAAQPLSVPDAIHADKTLGGTVQSALVLTCNWLELDAVLEWPVQIVLKKTGASV